MKSQKTSKITLYIIAFIMVSLLSMAFLGPCLVTAEEQVVYPRGGTVTIRLSKDPISFNGLVNQWSTTVPVLRPLFRRLGGLDKDYKLFLELAKSLDISPDLRTYTIRIHENVYFEDGSHLTSEYVKWQYEYAIDELANGVTRCSLVPNLESIETPDDYTIVFNWKEPQIDDQFMWFYGGTFQIVPMHLFKDAEVDMTNSPYNLDPVGFGPFLLDEYRKDEYAVFTRNDNYFGEVYLDKLVLKIIPSTSIAAIALEKGEVDISSIPFGEVDKFMANPKFNVIASPSATTIRIAFNFREEALEKHPWIGDINVRQAMAYAVDKQAIVDTLYYGMRELAHSPFTELLTDVYNPDINKYDYNPELAEQLLDAAGYTKGSDGWRFSFELITDARREDDAISVQHYWREIGIDCSIRAVESTAFFELYEKSDTGMGDFAMGCHNMPAGPSPYNSREWTLTHPSMGGLGTGNMGMWSNSRVDELWGTSSVEPDSTKRKEMFYEIQEIVTEEMPILFLWTTGTATAYNVEFGNVEEYYIKPYSYDVAQIYKGEPKTVGKTFEEITETIGELSSELGALSSRLEITSEELADSIRGVDTSIGVLTSALGAMNEDITGDISDLKSDVSATIEEKLESLSSTVGTIQMLVVVTCLVAIASVVIPIVKKS